MIQGIQITKAANDELLNSIWLLDGEKTKLVVLQHQQAMKLTKLLQSAT